MSDITEARELLEATVGSLEHWERNEYDRDRRKWSEGCHEDSCALCIYLSSEDCFTACGRCPLLFVHGLCSLASDNAWRIADVTGNKAPLIAALEKAVIYQTLVVFRLECEQIMEIGI